MCGRDDIPYNTMCKWWRACDLKIPRVLKVKPPPKARVIHRDHIIPPTPFPDADTSPAPEAMRRLAAFDPVVARALAQREGRKLPPPEED